MRAWGRAFRNGSLAARGVWREEVSDGLGRLTCTLAATLVAAETDLSIARRLIPARNQERQSGPSKPRILWHLGSTALTGTGSARMHGQRGRVVGPPPVHVAAPETGRLPALVRGDVFPAARVVESQAQLVCSNRWSRLRPAVAIAAVNPAVAVTGGGSFAPSALSFAPRWSRPAMRPAMRPRGARCRGVERSPPFLATRHISTHAETSGLHAVPDPWLTRSTARRLLPTPSRARKLAVKFVLCAVLLIRLPPRTEASPNDPKGDSARRG